VKLSVGFRTLFILTLKNYLKKKTLKFSDVRRQYYRHARARIKSHTAIKMKTEKILQTKIFELFFLTRIISVPYLLCTLPIPVVERSKADNRLLGLRVRGKLGTCMSLS
jgi:hypothetical protein